jgi:hypothetical protein
MIQSVTGDRLGLDGSLIGSPSLYQSKLLGLWCSFPNRRSGSPGFNIKQLGVGGSSPVFDGKFFDLFSPFNDSGVTPEVGVGGYHARLSQQVLLNSWFSVSSSFPTVITMKQKFFFTKNPQYVPRALMSHNEELECLVILWLELTTSRN